MNINKVSRLNKHIYNDGIYGYDNISRKFDSMENDLSLNKFIFINRYDLIHRIYVFEENQYFLPCNICHGTARVYINTHRIFCEKCSSLGVVIKDNVIFKLCPDCHGLAYDFNEAIKSGGYVTVCKKCNGKGIITWIDEIL